MTETAAPPQRPCPPVLNEQQLATLVNIEGDVQLKAAQLGMLCNEYHTNLDRVMLHYEPLMTPLRNIIFAGVQKRRCIETKLVWLERIIVMQERRGGSRLLPQRELQAIERDLMLPVQKAMQDSYQKLHIVTKEELTVLREYECPPRQALSTMEMALRVRGDEDTRWSTVQVVLSESYFFTFFISRAQTLLQQPLPDGVLEELETYCYSPEHAPDVLAQLSVPLGAIGQWLWAVCDHYRVKKIVESPDPNTTVEERRQMVTRLRHELQAIKEGMDTAAEELQRLQEEAMRKVVEVRNEYDDTMCPLHDVLEKKTEDFIKALGGNEVDADGESAAEGEDRQPQKAEGADDQEPQESVSKANVNESKTE
ncbi:hypothetical protein DQ04_00011260 [Trypanosoma grayi]|uniref:hypothetical protein n=1 Tax=Trypanosoma grayi TaxID=71804 RepID=UPI0004F43134|nr:hypothetical protein DQ04_00011260 [Trypanosoma grayi]KEG15659.1 hypothetical protein DQ04_00011260 [Trypanosoma grayi]